MAQLLNLYLLLEQRARIAKEQSAARTAIFYTSSILKLAINVSLRVHGRWNYDIKII